MYNKVLKRILRIKISAMSQFLSNYMQTVTEPVLRKKDQVSTTI